MEISKNFDRVANVVYRTKMHSKKDMTDDIVAMIDDVCNIKPFEFKSGRNHTTFPRCVKAMRHLLDTVKFRDWFQRKKRTYNK